MSLGWSLGGAVALLLAWGGVGCTFDPPGAADYPDTGIVELSDAGTDAGDASDTGAPDTGATDAGPPDAALDAGPSDVGTPEDAEVPDSGPPPPLFTPSNGILPGALEASQAVFDTSATQDVLLHTGTGQIFTAAGQELRPAVTGLDPTTGIGFEVVAQPQETAPLGVFTFGRVIVAAGTRLRGVGPNVLGLVSGSDIVVAGVIDVSGGEQACLPGEDRKITCPGPGAQPGASSCEPCCGSCRGAVQTCSVFCPSECVCDRCDRNHPSSGRSGNSGEGACFPESGGGGGGHGTAGGNGGDADGSINYANGVRVPGGGGGAAFGVEALSPITGGGGGGGGGDEPEASSRGGRGGGGGGAAQLVARASIVFSADSSGPCGLNAGGGGGAAGGESAGGGGGGAGGGLLLEAPTVSVGVGCGLSALGGGGGGADEGRAGASGPLSSQPAEGGASSGSCGTGPGAPGSAGSEDGADAPSCRLPPIMNCSDRCYQVGGGGGGAGRVRLHAVQTQLEGFVAPSPTLGALTGL